MPPNINLQTFQPGYAVIKCVALLEHSRIVPGSFTDSYYFDVSIHKFSVGAENPFLLCSLRHSAITSSDFPRGLYEIEAMVSTLSPPLRLSNDMPNR